MDNLIAGAIGHSQKMACAILAREACLVPASAKRGQERKWLPDFVLEFVSKRGKMGHADPCFLNGNHRKF